MPKSVRVVMTVVTLVGAISDSYLTPEAHARRKIDEQLRAAGWAVQNADKVNLAAGQGVAVQEFVLKPPPRGQSLL